MPIFMNAIICYPLKLEIALAFLPCNKYQIQTDISAELTSLPGIRNT